MFGMLYNHRCNGFCGYGSGWVASCDVLERDVLKSLRIALLMVDRVVILWLS